MVEKLTEDREGNQQDTASNNLAIEISSLVYRYPKAKVNALEVHLLQVAKGEHIFLQGASGSGKSTLLQLLCGLRCGTGELRIAGTNIGKLSQAKRDRFRARHIGMVFQQFNLIPYLSAVDNVVLAANLAGFGNGAKERAEELIGQVGMSQTIWKQAASSLSIGQQQRVAIVRALINSPDILLLDEPTSALDEENQTLFMTILQSHLTLNPATTVVFVSHDTRLSSFFNRSVNLSDISTCTLLLGKNSDG